MLRGLLIGIGVISAVVGCLAEFAAFASAQVAAPPVVVVATIPPEPTPLPRLVLPREEFATQAVADVTPSPDVAMPGTAGQSMQQLALTSYGVVTVSYDEQHPDNSYALISTPHGVLQRKAQEIVDGYRVIGITKAGVVFQGGVFIPVGYSQQSSNPQVPPIGGSLPRQQVPVNVYAAASPSPSPAPVASSRTVPIGPHGAPPARPIQQTNVFEHQPQPQVLNNQQVLPSPQAANIVNPLAAPTPSQ